MTHVERVSIWSVVACLVAVAGFQAGKLGTKVAFPSPQAVFAGAKDALAFGDQAVEEAALTDQPVAAVFGAPAPQQAAPVAAEPAPMVANTTYSLQGITVVGQSRWAMLSSGGANMLVRMGDTLADGELVKDITPDAVILTRDGDVTILEFARLPVTGEETASDGRPEIMADFNPVEAPPATPRVTTVTAAQAAANEKQVELVEQPPLHLQELRRAIYAPNALSNVHFVRARTLDGTIGWHLKWIKDSPLVEAAGLQRGDILVSINGVSIENGRGLQGLILGLSKIDKLEIEYERRKRPVSVTIPLTK